MRRENTRKYIEGILIPKKYKISNGKEVTTPFPIGTYIIIILVILSIISIVITDVDLNKLVTRGHKFFLFFTRMFPVDRSFLSQAIGPMIDTIQMSILGSFVGSAVALPFAFLASSNINKFTPLLFLIRFILTLFRTLPVLIYALVLTLLYGFGEFAGTIAIMLFTFSIVSKMLYEKIETIDLGAYEAIQSTGATKAKSVVVAIIPQVLPTFISTSLYSFEINIRYAAILGYVGAGGIGLLINDKMGWKEYNKVGLIFIMLLVVVLAIETLSRTLRRELE